MTDGTSTEVRRGLDEANEAELETWLDEETGVLLKAGDALLAAQDGWRRAQRDCAALSVRLVEVRERLRKE